MKKIVILIIISLLFINIYNAKEVVTLSKCIDGDTARFIYNNEEVKVRFLGIDAPEYTTSVEKYGKEASYLTCTLLENANTIEIEFDGKEIKDKYDRYLAWIFVDNELLEEELLRKGLARVRYIYDDYLYTDKLYEAENFAKENKLGIWSDTNYDEVTTYDENNIESIIIIIFIAILSLFIIKLAFKK